MKLDDSNRVFHADSKYIRRFFNSRQDQKIFAKM